MLAISVVLSLIIIEGIILYANYKGLMILSYEQLVISVVLTVLIVFGIIIYKLLKLALYEYGDEE